MAQKQTILSERFDTIQSLHFTLESIDSIAGSQLITITASVAPYLPALVAIHQRTPKGALTVNLADIVIEITHRGKVARAYRTL